jgi:hypothetical protein
MDIFTPSAVGYAAKDDVELSKTRKFHHVITLAKQSAHL